MQRASNVCSYIEAQRSRECDTGQPVAGACDDPDMRRNTTVIALLAIAVSGCLSGCVGGGSTTASVPGGADPGAVKVITAWVDALRTGNVQKASSYFRLPSVVQNGSLPVALRTTQDVIAFNESLPCGAVLVSATREGRFTAATFKLTDRPGGGCGAGTGATARTAFAIDSGKISEWRRIPDQPSAPQGRVV
jgi:hypothetical protein